jgi:hypothetical protein
MGFLGNLLGQGLGYLGGGLFGDSGTGSKIGGALGNFLPFEKGGKVPGGRGKAVPTLLHGGEYILPASVKPTKAQMKKVADGKRKKK